MGGTDVDYKTEFMSEGINQTNYKIWLTVNITVSLANPIYSKNVNMTRKIMLVDTVIKGEVPSSYLGVPLADLFPVFTYIYPLFGVGIFEKFFACKFYGGI